MSNQFKLDAEVRSEAGKGASRRLRHTGKVPAIIYGAGKDPESLLLDHNDLSKALENEAFYSHILDIKIGKSKQQAVLKDVQRHPFKQQIMHIDLLRVAAKEQIRMNVPLHFINEDVCVGVKTDGGAISHTITDVEIICLPKNLPEYIEVDLSELQLGETVHMSDLEVPKGVELVQLSHGNDMTVASVHVTGGDDDEDEGAIEEGGEVPTAADEEQASEE